MSDSTSLFIGLCWIAWAGCWVAMAFGTKRTIERGGLVGYRIVALALVVGLLVAGRLSHLSSQSELWQTSLALGVVTDCMVLAGAAFSIWARITLGRNWSAEVTFKQDHELIESGPYALARHPIYTGLFFMALGTAINYGRAIGFAVLFAMRFLLVEGAAGGADDEQPFPRRLRRLQDARPRNHPVRAVRPTGRRQA
jgi:hypothetical protein